MGLQDSLVMSVVPAHDVFKSRVPSSTMSATSANLDRKELILTEAFQALALNNEHENSTEIDDSANKNEATNSYSGPPENNNDDEMDRNRDHGDHDIVDENGNGFNDDAEWEADEVKLSKALHCWLSDYVITPLPRQAHTLRQPVFSACLGRESNIRRADSSDSLDTQLSLFSCSSYGSRKSREKKRRRLRRRKTICAETAEGLNPPSSAATSNQGSRWVELAKRKKGELDRFMMAQSHALSQGFNLLSESEAFQLCDPDEKRALFLCGKRCKMAWARGLKKSSSMTNITQDPKPKRKQRVASAGAKTFFGKQIDFQELKRQMMNKRLASLSSWHRLRSSARGARSLHRSLSKNSLTSVGSNDVFLSANTPLNVSPPPSEGVGSVGGGVKGRGGGEGAALAARRESQLKDRNVSMWKGDSEILAIDLKRELTTKVKQRITITTTALERVTGLGDNNEQRPSYTRHLPEFPAYVDQDYGLRPKIPQKIRISPHLSDVIKSDIRVRMGRPRYHEIREQDLEVWCRGQTLDRSHRNLKVFNWLHSLKEDEFDLTPSSALLQQHSISEGLPHATDDLAIPYDGSDMLLIRAVDDPDVRPLFEHAKKKKKKMKKTVFVR